MINEPNAQRVRRLTHQMIQKVSEDIAAFRFNTMLAAMMEFTNALSRERDAGPVDGPAWDEAIGALVLCLAPSAPHIAEELWLRNGWDFSIHDQLLPEWDETKLVVDTVRIVVQVNGLVRDTITVPTDAGEKEIASAALSSPGALRHTQDRVIRRTIHVPGRLVNIVVG